MSSMAPKHATSPAISQMKSLFKQFLRITTTDGRIFLGTFVGTDKHLNTLLANTEEFRFAPPEEINSTGRFVGLVMIPRRLIVKIEAPEGAVANDDDGGAGSDEDDEMYT